ncbi:MAG: acetylornithine deacetylase, partial [Dasosvirus sp.]
TPFYDWKCVRQVLDKHIDELNKNPKLLPQQHKAFPYCLDNEEKSTVNFELKWLSDPYVGIACNMESVGFKLISEATKKIKGDMDYNSCTGSLPLIAELHEQGFDMQIIGYGVGQAYHANDEYCRFSGMKMGYSILMDVINNY